MVTEAKPAYVEIADEGRYQISTDPNQRYYHYGSGERMWPEGYYITGDPFVLPSSLMKHLIATFPDLQRLNFKPSQFNDGNLTAMELDYAPAVMDYDKWEGFSGYFDFDGHINLISGKRELSRKHHSKDTFHLRMEDKGSLRVIRNNIEFRESKLRNGQLMVRTFGIRGSDKSYTGSMCGFVEIHGDKPGELIAASIDFVREFVKEQGYPVWKKES